MLSTLLKLGEELSQNRGDWDDIIDIPNTQIEKSKGYNLYVAEIVFDLYQQSVYASQELSEYDDNSPSKYKNLKIQGGNNKAIYVCVESGKIDQIKKSLFGKEDNAIQGEFIEAINKDFPQFKNTQFYQVLEKIFLLKGHLYELYNQKDDKGKIKSIESVLSESLNLGSNNRVVLWCASVICNELEIRKSTQINQLSGYDDFIKAKFLDKSQNLSTEQKISYTSGKFLKDVVETDFTTRYSLNKMFVKETKNYASNFDDKQFNKNYQVNWEEQLYLERASKYILEKQQIRIAGIDHCIIPQFLSYSKVNIQDVLIRSFQHSELLFQTQVFTEFKNDIEDNIDSQEIFWINFFGFESDGNFFKTLNLIKDVSSLHLLKVIKIFRKIGQKMKILIGIVDWEAIMTEYIEKERKQVEFNLQTMYYLIPQRKDKEKKNEALAIFKSILEQRKINPTQIYHHFCNLILCHYYKRYEAFKNIRKYGEDAFDFAIRDTLFKYLAFIQVLKHLNLLENMEINEENELDLVPLEESAPADFTQKIELFFDQMKYSNAQKAMFYLGRMLSSVAYIQKEKKKTVLEKVNFNGMDKKDIQRLRLGLLEKAEQYKEIGKVIFNDSLFTKYFDYNNWNMSEQEAVFFLLSGYSFGIQTKDKKEENKTK
jgi:CRISPR-associated protein Csh1